MGADIAGACGQLVQKKKQTQSEVVIGDIEDSPFGKTVTRKNKREVKNDQRPTYKTLDTKLNKYAPPSDNGFEQWVRPLAYATAVASSCFAFSLVLLLSRRTRR